MRNFKKILVAVNIDTSADQVLMKAAQMAFDTRTLVSVLYVSSRAVPIYNGFMGEGACMLDDTVTDEVAVCKQLQQQLDIRVKKSGLLTAKSIVEFGRAVDVILDVAESESTELIVIGSHGRHGLGLLLGSTANGVLHRAKCDVLAVRINA